MRLAPLPRSDGGVRRHGGCRRMELSFAPHGGPPFPKDDGRRIRAYGGGDVPELVSKRDQTAPAGTAGLAITQSVISLDRVEAVTEAVAGCSPIAASGWCAAGAERRGSAQAAARAWTEHYGANTEERRGEGRALYEPDPPHAADPEGASGSQDRRRGRRGTLDAVRDAVRYRVRGRARPQANGLPCSFPATTGP